MVIRFINGKWFCLRYCFLLICDQLSTCQRRPDATPSLHAHYKRFLATTSSSAPVPCLGTLTLANSVACISPLNIMTTGSRSSQEKPDTKSRPLYAGHRLRSIRNSLADLSQKIETPLVLMSVSGLRRVHMGSG